MKKVRIGRNYVANLDAIVPILKGPDMTKVVEDAADIIAERARSLAPVHTGHYRDSITVTLDEHPTRIAAHIGAHADYGLVVESRTHVLRRALG